jgi:hypothetical protein
MKSIENGIILIQMKNITKTLSRLAASTIPLGILILLVFSLTPKAYVIPNLSSNPLYTETIHPLTQKLIEEQKLKINEKVQAVLLEEQIQREIAKVKSFFESYGAVMTGYEEILVRKAHECGGDYRVLVGIAGNESGLGRIPYNLYNPYGYLDGMTYSSWEESLNKLSCVISQRFVKPCGVDLQCIINKYGGPDTDQAKWIRNVSWFMNQVTL